MIYYWIFVVLAAILSISLVDGFVRLGGITIETAFFAVGTLAFVGYQYARVISELQRLRRVRIDAVHDDSSL